MTEQQFQEISKLSNDEFSALDNDTQIEYLNMLKEKNKSQSSNTVPIETYVELGANLGVEVADSITGATDMAGKIVAKKTAETLTGTQTAIVYLKMAQSVYSIVKGEFKWDLLNTVSLLSSTLACLTAIGINIACMTALTTILASSPFTFALAVIVAVINYFSIGNQLAKLKKQYMTCYNSYRRLKKLCKWCDTNEIIYTGIKRVIEGCKQKCNDMIIYLTEHEKELNNMMTRKIFVGADFNSFVLFTNIITFIQSAQDLSTTRNGVYNDYIDFCSIEDYIDTHEIIKQDKCRIEYYILQGDTYGLKNFTIALDYLKGFLETYKLNAGLTKQTLSDISYVYKCIEELNNTIGTQNLINLQKENEKFLDSRNPEELFNSIYSYLVYSQSMKDSPFIVCASLLNPEYYKEQDIYEYVSAFSEYPVFLFSKWFFYFGNIMYNDIYIENYKSEIINAYNKDKQLYDYTFMKDLTDNINTFNDYKIILLWLFSIREFLENILYKQYEKYSPVYATSITQTAIDKDGKALYNFYLPNDSYLIPKIKSLVGNFVYYMKKNGYNTDKYSYLLENFWLFKNYDKDINVSFINLGCIDSLMGKWDLGGILGKFNAINDNIYNLLNTRTYTYTYTGKNIYGKTENKTGYRKYESGKLKTSFETFKNMYNDYSNNSIVSNGFLNGAYIRSVRDDGKFAFGKTKDFNIDIIDYLGSSNSINEFFYRILNFTKDIKYLYAYMVLIFDGRWSNNWGGSFFEIAYLLDKSKTLRDLFFNGYEFKTTHNRDEYLKSLWEFVKGERQDIIFYWADNYCPNINLHTFADDMVKQSNYKAKIETLYNDFKNVYNDYISAIKYDIKFAVNSINEQIANFETILDKYVKYDSSLSYAYTDKNNTYLWNLYKTARDLGVNNKGYITNIEKHLIPVYKLKDGYIQLETYYPPMFVLMSAQDDSNISQAYYLFNKTAINSLFDIANEKFSEKVNEFKELVDLSVQPIVIDINHDKILQDIKTEMEKSYNISQEELIERLGSQEDEYILMENLTNTEILKSNNEKINSSNEELAIKTQKDIDNTRVLLDNKKVIKYTILGGVGFIVAKFLGRK